MKKRKIDWDFWLTVIFILLPMILISVTFCNAEERVTEEELMREVIADVYISTIVCDPKDVTRLTNLKEEHYEILTQGTWWEGNESALRELEFKYGINAIFGMAVSSLESGYGESSMAKYRHNYYGLSTKTRWNSLHHNTQYWGNLMNTKYVSRNLTSVSSIAPVYCPPMTKKWTKDVTNLMRRFHMQLIKKMRNTNL